MDKRQHDLLVIIVTYNAMQWAKRCFDSLLASSVKCDVYVVDNGSTDRTQDYIQKEYPDVMFSQSEENLGFGRANNKGLDYAIQNDYKYVYLLNQDAWVLPDTFERLIKVSCNHSEYGILSPMQLQANMEHFDNNFRITILGYSQSSTPSLVEDLYFQRGGDIYEVDKVMAAHWLLTRECVLTVGGFSPSFPHYGEDDNFIHRAHYWKMKVGVVPSAKAVHDRSDPVWSQEKEAYVNYYIQQISRCSNPNHKHSVIACIMQNFISYIIYRKPGFWKYSKQLFQQKSKFEENFKKSLAKQAFL